jgi:CHU_C Type IX secretion signal domain
MRFLITLPKLLLTGCFLVLMHLPALATHLRAGEITATRIGCSREFRICLNIYVNTNPNETTVEFGGGELRFGDGKKPHITPTRASVPVPGAEYVGKVEYCINYTYESFSGSFKISYFELNRNADIRNITNSVEVNFFLETWIEMDPFKGCDNSPRLLVPPIDKACTGSRWEHNPGAYDPDGDSLSYKLIAPRHVPDIRIFKVDTVPGYQDPNSPAYYGSNYANAQQDGSGKPILRMDSVTGTITWDAPGTKGEYNIAFLIIEWRKVNDVWQKIGYITRDMQIIVEQCTNLPPVVVGPADICVQAGDVVTADFFGTDHENGGVAMQAFSETFFLDVSPATFTPPLNTDDTAPIQPSSPFPAKLTFTWQTSCEHVKQQPYLIVVKITDNGPLSAFATLRVTVVGPPPEWNQAVIAPNRSVQLDWDAYTCAVKADSMQVWRRIDSAPYTRQDCVIGMPEGLGYKKIKTVAIGQIAYLDTNKGKGLPPGATVCYRLVATFPPPFDNSEGGSESYVSDEICIGPILADAPVMTNVSVDTTNRDKGRITVRWTPPFDLDPIDFPPPYKYDVFRAVGFTGNASIVKISTKQTDTVFVDRSINTFDNVYNYSVLVYDNTDTEVDTSAIASSVRLQAKSLIEKIELTWTADVPWSLQSAISPKHYIYRGGKDATESELVLIDSVFSTQDILQYTDAGTYNGEVLQDNQTYCYRVETHGGYGFDDPSKIPEPLINFSQIVCARPSDLNPPCKPDLAIEVLDCKEYFELYGCDYNDFKNVLRWPRPADNECRDDISHYRIYYANEYNADTTEYKLLVDLADRPLDTMYVDRNLPSFARCYRLKAVDRSGNESPFSARACNDNCPNYQLPNVFTPGNGDDCNDLFSAFSDRNIIGGILQCGDVQATPANLASIQALCPRFVLRVDVVIVDRWGKQVFTYSSGGENTIFIDWNGLDNNGRVLPSGVYFYSAKVIFEALKPQDREKIIKGWVQLVRAD